MAVMQNDHQRLRDLLKNGISTSMKSVDGATAMHRAAEVGSIICAEILLQYETNINALNFAGQTPFHIASLNRNVEFGQFLLKN